MLDADARLEAALRLAEEDPAAVLAIVGPTASGKTDLALAIAARQGGEIVSADSVQIYRHFDIGSGKPSAEERARVRHHLIDALEPDDDIDAARFAALGRAAIDDVRARGRRPILCGGTFLWVKALLFGLADAPPADEATRERHRAIAAAEGRPALHAMLAKVDPQIAARLHPNDLVRVSRALEVYELAGEALSARQERHRFATAQVHARMIGIEVSPEELSKRIAARVAAFLEAGWLAEVERLLAAGYGQSRPMGSVGYREIHQWLAGPLAGSGARPPDGPQAARLDLPQLQAAIVRSTRVFARRQRTWLHHADVTWL